MHTNIGSGVSVFHHILIEFINKIIKKKKKKTEEIEFKLYRKCDVHSIVYLLQTCV